jgi:autophagy-related protein 9
MDIDEENLGARFEPQDLDHLLEEASSSQMITESTAFLPPNHERAPPGLNTANRAMGWRHPLPAQAVPPPDEDDDVPQSLLLEGGIDAPKAHRTQRTGGLPPPVPGPSTRQTQAQWETTRQQHRLHDDGRGNIPARTWGHPGRPGPLVVDPREKAQWFWVNQTDLDAFLHEAYQYYRGCGMWSIMLRVFLLHVQTLFMVGFLTFLGWCIDYSKLRGSHKMGDVLVDKCLKR